jgi:predicted transcriptional regulator
METSVLLSIRPEFSDAILDGRKTYELRRRVFGRRDVRRCVIYSSSPIRRVVGDFRIEKVLALTPRKLWEVTSRGAAIDRRRFDAYFQGLEIGFALKIGSVHRFSRSRDLHRYCGLRQPPQSFCYLRS